MLDTVEKQFALLHKQVGDYQVRMFAANYAYLSEIYGCFTSFAERELVIHASERLTYAECAAKAAQLAQHLSTECAVEPGSRIGLALANSPEWMIAFIAVSALGATPVLINSHASQPELAHCLTSTDCTLCLHERLELPDVAIQELPLSTIIDIIATTEQNQLPMVECANTDEALLMFTSGTTGLPKAAVLSHEGVLTALQTIQYSGALITQQMAQTYGIDYETLVQMRPPSVNLLVFPLFHVSGCHAVFLTSLLQGGKIVLMPRWHAEDALQLIASEKVTTFPGVPTMHRDLLQLENRNAYDLSSLTSISIGGQGTSPTLLQEIHKAFPQAVIGTGYGMTECNGTVTLTVGEPFLNNPRSAGKMVATIDAEIRDDKGRVLSSGEIGEIHLRGATLMSGYANVDEPVFDAAGWFSTGDVGYFDDQGYWYIVDRKTDMVISGGENIYCAEVERATDLHSAVLESAAFAMPDERLGEKLVATVVLMPKTNVDADEIIAHCADHLAKYKVPKQIRIQWNPLPRTASGKLIKRSIRELYAAALASTEH